MSSEQRKEAQLLDALKRELLKLHQRAISSSADDVDLLSINLFASLVKQHEQLLALDATRVIALRLDSDNANEILQSLNILEECMSNCGPRFRNEVGKFRFLNELIRLVSPQYKGDQTDRRVRDKIMDLLLLWTVNHQDEGKIKEAYEMLLKRGVIHELKNKHGPSSNGSDSASSKTSKPVSKTDAMQLKLKTLLQSTNPSDHKAANLLIQNMVKETERKTEIKIRRKLELKEISDNACLLREMLDQIRESAKAVSEDVLATVRDLHDRCVNLRPTISIITGELDENDFLEEALEVNDLIVEVFQKFDQLIAHREPPIEDILSSMVPTGATCNRSQLVSTATGEAPANLGPNNTLDELSEIFTNQALDEPSTPLQPVIATTTSTPLTLPPLATSSTAWQPSQEQFLSNATTLTLMDLKESIFDKKNAVTPTFPPESPKKPSMKSKLTNLDSEITEMVSGLKSNLRKDPSPVIGDLLLSDILHEDDQILEHNIDGEKFDKVENEKTLSDFAMKNELLGAPVISEVIELKPPIEETTPNEKQKALSEFHIELSALQPDENQPPRIYFDDPKGLKIVVNFVKNRPRDDITVLVITTTNQNCLPITNYQFEASVSKPCKLRLQSASVSELPGVKPFRPPTEDITQILLLSNLDRKSLKLVCIVSYLLGDDPDPVKEFFEINDLPC